MRAKLNNQLNGRISKHNVRILTNPAHSRLRSELADERRGFVKDTGTRNAIFMIRVISEQMQRDVYLYLKTIQTHFKACNKTIYLN